MRWSRMFSSMGHSRDITCHFTETKASYTIPMYFGMEEKMFGSVLELQFEMDDEKGLYVLSKKGQSLGCCDEKVAYYKTKLIPLQIRQTQLDSPIHPIHLA
jgi:hypothetical protein